MKTKKEILTRNKGKYELDLSYRLGQDGFADPIGWNFSLMDETSGLPWVCTYKKLAKYRQQLLSLEGKSFLELEQDNKSNHCWESYDFFDNRAQEFLKNAKFDIGILWQLRLSSRTRIFGIRNKNIFKILWLDEQHQIYKVSKKNSNYSDCAT